MTHLLSTAKIWNGTQWVTAAGGDIDWPVGYKYGAQTSFNVTSSATAHTKGAWTQIYASTTVAADCLILRAASSATSGSNNSMLIDIGIGAAGSETTIVGNIAIGSGSPPWLIPVPVYIPSGSRVSVRTQSAITSRTISMQFYGFSGPNPSGTSTSATVLGSDTADSTATALNGTVSTFNTISSSTPAAYQSIVTVPSGRTNTLSTLTYILITAKGAAGSEIALSSSMFQSTTTEQVTLLGGGQQYLGAIPAGTRLSVETEFSASANIGACIIATEVIGQ